MATKQSAKHYRREFYSLALWNGVGLFNHVITKEGLDDYIEVPLEEATGDTMVYTVDGIGFPLKEISPYWRWALKIGPKVTL